MYDAVIVPGGAESADTLKEMDLAVQFVMEAYGHAKTVGALGEGAMVGGSGGD